MANQELLKSLKEFIDTEFKAIPIKGLTTDTNSGACFTISKVASLILIGLGYDCDVKRIMVLAGNDIGRAIFKEQEISGNYNVDEYVKRNGWTLGLGVPPYFHFIVYFEKEKEIMDLTFGQADRPDKNLRLYPYWVNVKNLPDTIMGFEFIQGTPIAFNPVFYKPQYRRIFKKIVKKGILKLQKYSVREGEKQW